MTFSSQTRFTPLSKKEEQRQNKQKQNSRVFTIFLEVFTPGKLFCKEFKPGGGTPHIKGVGILVGNFELNP